MIKSSLTRPLSVNELEGLGGSILQSAAISELAMIFMSLGLAWLIASWLRRHHGKDFGSLSVLFGRGVTDGLLFPLLALAFCWAAGHALPLIGVPPAYVRLAIPLLMSLVLIRLTVRVLTAALPSSGLLRLVSRIVSWTAWAASVLWVLGLLPGLLDDLDDVQFHVGATKLSLLGLFSGLLTSLIVLVLALWMAQVIESRLMKSNMDLSLKKMASNASKAGLLFIGLLVALEAAGIDLTALSVLGGAIGVGIGFGLQKLASNYVSGFVILAERSLRIGDMVKVDGFEGRISDIKTRYTVVRALNGRESIVPNEMLITQRVENASLADTKVSVGSTVVVGSATDLDALIPQLVETMSKVPRVLADPGPSVMLSNFAADGLELTLSFWINDPHNGQGGVRSEVNLAVLRLLTRLGVDIPYPQRVIHQA